MRLLVWGVRLIMVWPQIIGIWVNVGINCRHKNMRTLIRMNLSTMAHCRVSRMSNFICRHWTKWSKVFDNKEVEELPSLYKLYEFMLLDPKKIVQSLLHVIHILRLSRSMLMCLPRVLLDPWLPLPLIFPLISLDLKRATVTASTTPSTRLNILGIMIGSISLMKVLIPCWDYPLCH